MARSLLNTLPTWVLALAGVGGCAALAVAGLLLVRKRFPELGRTEINDVAGIAIGVLAAVYGIILGFVIVSLYEDFTAAEANVVSEAAQLIQLYEDTRGMPIARAMQDEMRTYVANVRFREFELMKEGRSYAQLGDKHVGDMYRVLRGYSPRTENRVAFYEDAVTQLNAVVSSRIERLHDATQELPTPFAVLLLVGAALLIASMYLLAVPKLHVHMTIVIAVAVLTSFNLLIAVALDHPFSGDVSVSSKAFGEDKLAELHATPVDADRR
ncbi:MAG: hypothetical protein QOK16_4492 [Solirubrobacteraceae bacterium]|nr:hypothetical protein [Solirubrobacteraceae bacterium]